MMPEENEDKLKKFIEDKYRSYNKWAKSWSAIYYSSLYIAAALGAVAALVLKLDYLSSFPYQTDLAAGLAGLAALVAAITAAGGFDRKWRVNRYSRNMLEQLKIDLISPDVKYAEVVAKLKEIMQKREEGIAGTEK